MPNKKKIIWDEIFIQTKRLVKQIQNSEVPFTNIIAVSRGGLIPARLIADLLNIRRIYTIGIAMYDQKHQHQALVYQTLPIVFQSENGPSLIIDDIADTGESLKIAIKEIEQFKPVNDYKICSLYYKPKSQILPHFYSTVVENDTWIQFPWEED